MLAPSSRRLLRWQGSARALLLNRGTCPSPPAACVGLCSLTWLVEYDPYTRESAHLYEASVVSSMVPVTAPPTDDWLVGVQALDEGESIEFSLQVGSRQRGKAVTNYTCDRMAHFCPTVQREENITGYDPATQLTAGSAMSAASRRAAPAAGLAWAAVGLAAAAAVRIRSVPRW